MVGFAGGSGRNDTSIKRMSSFLPDNQGLRRAFTCQTPAHIYKVPEQALESVILVATMTIHGIFFSAIQVIQLYIRSSIHYFVSLVPQPITSHSEYSVLPGRSQSKSTGE
jgi:hypothetical protein